MDRLGTGAMLRIAVGIGGVALSAASVGADHQRPSVLTIRVYDTVRLPASTAAGLRATTESALVKAGVALRWVLCFGDVAQDADCAVPLARRDVMVRVTERHEPAERCGFALLTHGPGFVSLARECAARTAADLVRGRSTHSPDAVTEAEVLGFTLAHELAHVLLPEMPHSSGGLFRAHLGRTEWEELLPSGRLTFRPKHIALLREAALRRYESGGPPLVGLEAADRGAARFSVPQPR